MQVVRRLMSAFNERDIAHALALMDPGVEFFAPQTALSVEMESPYLGHDGIRQYFDDVSGVWERLQVVAHEFRAKGAHVVALGSIVGERNGQPVKDDVAWAWKLRKGKIVWGRVYQRPSDALDDAGIE